MIVWVRFDGPAGVSIVIVVTVWQELAAVGNPSAEVLVTLGGAGSMHFGGDWAAGGDADERGLLAHEARMGFFPLSTPGA